MALKSLNIPEEALPDLEKIAALDEPSFRSLLAALREVEPSLQPFQLERKLAEKEITLSQADLRSVLNPVIALFRLKERSEESAHELAKTVVRSDLISKSAVLGDKEKQLLEERLAQFLSLENSLGVTAKALDVMTEHERIFCKARILTDIRPVFSEGPEVAPAAVIIHNLQIGYHRNGEHNELYVALDTDDLQYLKKVIERAERKTEALRAILKKADLSYLEV